MEPVLTVALPVFAIIAAGYLSGRGGLFGPAASQDLTTVLGGHARTEAVPTLADELGRLECAFHGWRSIGVQFESGG